MGIRNRVWLYVLFWNGIIPTVFFSKQGLILPPFMRQHLPVLCSIIFVAIQASAQSSDDRLIRTKDGGVLGYRKALVIQCKKAYGAPPDNKLIAKICECEVGLIDQRYTLKQIQGYDKKYKGEGLSMLMQEDTLLQQQQKMCSAGA